MSDDGIGAKGSPSITCK